MSEHKRTSFWNGLANLLTGVASIWLLFSLFESFFIWSTHSKRRGAFFVFAITFPLAYLGAGFVITLVMELFGLNDGKDVVGGQMLASAIIALIASTIFAAKDMAKSAEIPPPPSHTAIHLAARHEGAMARASREWNEMPPLVAFLSVTFILIGIFVFAVLMAVYCPEF